MCTHSNSKTFVGQWPYRCGSQRPLLPVGLQKQEAPPQPTHPPTQTHVHAPPPSRFFPLSSDSSSFHSSSLLPVSLLGQYSIFVEALI